MIWEGWTCLGCFIFPYPWIISPNAYSAYESVQAPFFSPGDFSPRKTLIPAEFPMIDHDDAEFKTEIARISENVKKTMKKIQNIIPDKAEKTQPELPEETQTPKTPEK